MRKTFNLIFLGLVLSVFTVFSNLKSVSALSRDSYGASVYETTEEICELIGDGCETVSDSEINLNSSEKIALGVEDSLIIFELPTLTINFYSPLELKGEVSLVGDSILNDFNETSSSTIYSESNTLNLFQISGKTVINNLKLESIGEANAFYGNRESSLTINDGTYKAENIIVAGNNQKIIINGGNFEAKNHVLVDLNKATDVLIKDVNFKSLSGPIMNVKLEEANLKIISGTFEASKENKDAEIFKFSGSTSESDSKNILKNLLSEGSEVYDLENNTTKLSYRNTYIDQKGETNFGFLSTNKIIIRETGGRGEEPETPDVSETQKEDSDPAPEEPETEENPDTLTDHPVIYFSGITISIFLGFLSLKKYLDL